ncbi:MAG: serine/threonine-protein kinase [Pirellulaceae bacterium]|nr:serine/threonine-protein kinase [Pirellulaceae bacterium]
MNPIQSSEHYDSLDSAKTTAPARGPAELQTVSSAASGQHLAEFESGTRRKLAPGYEFLGELGRGGMGVVYRARQLSAKRDVALKMILSGDHAAGAELDRFRAEAEAVANLQHPNIIAVFDVGEHEGRPYFSMEYCPGGTLASLARQQPLPVAEAAAMVLKLARAIAAAHAQGIVHRDLKPTNVLLGADGEPKISDFGLSKRLDADQPAGGPTLSGQVLGTPSYMAPEQAFGYSKHVGPPADVYALGAILYELLVGRPPFRGPSAVDTILLVVSEDAEPVRRIRPEVPRDLEAICMKCLERAPTRRYPSALELAADLARYLEGEPVSVGQSGLVGLMTGALDRVQLKTQFASFANLLLAAAPLMFLTEVIITLIVWLDWPSILLVTTQISRAAIFLVLVGYFRNWRWLPSGGHERPLWMLLGGYLLSCIVLGVTERIARGLDASFELEIYLPLASFTALLFFALAPNHWGYCAVIGLGFLATAFLMALNLWFAPLWFGAAWGVALVVIGVKLRQLAQA